MRIGEHFRRGSRMVKQVRYIGAVIFAACCAFALMAGSELGYSIIKVCMLFVILLAGYKYGPGTGTLCGTVTGIVLALFTKDIGQLGILCVIGCMAGVFRQLGRFATVVGYLAAAVGVGILYAPNLLAESISPIIIAGAIFCLLPIRLARPESSTVKRKPVTVSTEDYQSNMGGRLEELERVLSELSNAFEPGNLKDTISSEMPEEYWRSRCIENRMAMSGQMAEFAQMMGNLKEEMDKTFDLTPEVSKAISRSLNTLGIAVERMLVTEDNEGKGEATFTLAAKGGYSIPVKDIAVAVSGALGKSMCVASDSASIVTRLPRTIRLKEDTRYQMVQGIARTRKTDSQKSGDCFSCMELPRGKMLYCLCDGMGSGEDACRESARAIELAEGLLGAGFQPQTAIRIVNQALMLQEDVNPLTLDLAVVDLHTGLCDLSKSGAAVTLIRRRDRVEVLQSDTLPVGILQDSMPVESLVRLTNGDLIIMMTDGVLEAMPGLQKEDRMRELCLDLDGKNPQEFAEQILEYAMEQGAVRDDMTVLVAGIWKK